MVLHLCFDLFRPQTFQAPAKCNGAQGKVTHDEVSDASGKVRGRSTGAGGAPESESGKTTGGKVGMRHAPHPRGNLNLQTVF